MSVTHPSQIIPLQVLSLPRSPTFALATTLAVWVINYRSDIHSPLPYRFNPFCCSDIMATLRTTEPSSYNPHAAHSADNLDQRSTAQTQETSLNFNTARLGNLVIGSGVTASPSRTITNDRVPRNQVERDQIKEDFHLALAIHNSTQRNDDDSRFGPRSRRSSAVPVARDPTGNTYRRSMQTWVDPFPEPQDKADEARHLMLGKIMSRYEVSGDHSTRNDTATPSLADAMSDCDEYYSTALGFYSSADPYVQSKPDDTRLDFKRSTTSQHAPSHLSSSDGSNVQSKSTNPQDTSVHSSTGRSRSSLNSPDSSHSDPYPPLRYTDRPTTSTQSECTASYNPSLSDTDLRGSNISSNAAHHPGTGSRELSDEQSRLWSAPGYASQSGISASGNSNLSYPDLGITYEPHSDIVRHIGSDLTGRRLDERANLSRGDVYYSDLAGCIVDAQGAAWMSGGLSDGDR